MKSLVSLVSVCIKKTAAKRTKDNIRITQILKLWELLHHPETMEKNIPNHHALSLDIALFVSII